MRAFDTADAYEALQVNISNANLRCRDRGRCFHWESVIISERRFDAILMRNSLLPHICPCALYSLAAIAYPLAALPSACSITRVRRPGKPFIAWR